MMTLEEIRAALGDRILVRVARNTGISRGTLWAIREGRMDNPNYETIKTLSDYLSGPVREEK